MFEISLSDTVVLTQTMKCCNVINNVSSCFQVIRHYHGHLSAVHDISLHPTIDVLVTCGRDSTARVMYYFLYQSC